MNLQKYRNLVNLCYVKRWSHAPLHREQSVAEHTFRVMALGRALNVLLDHPVDGFHFLLHAMDHDQEEAITGDHPGPEKDKLKSWPHPFPLAKWEVLTKVADALECHYWWWVWGEKSWNHPQAPSQGDSNRDIRKIIWYTQGWPELLVAVQKVMEEILGYDHITVKALFGGE